MAVDNVKIYFDSNMQDILMATPTSRELAHSKKKYVVVYLMYGCST